MRLESQVGASKGSGQRCSHQGHKLSHFSLAFWVALYVELENII